MVYNQFEHKKMVVTACKKFHLRLLSKDVHVFANILLQVNLYKIGQLSAFNFHYNIYSLKAKLMIQARQIIN